ncbi:sucrose phosphorylase [Candidatus Parcubacteria bacterium]|nr:MAG: sucrose phosphorylase [Candidatus Parcubacteria bacterium]
MKEKNYGVQLISYPDSLGKDLKELDIVLNKYFKDVIKGIHILPFYPSSADRGFAPLTHRQIDPKFGNQDDLKKISQNFELMVDLIVNHVSSESRYFQDYLENGDNSKYRNYFIKAKYFSRRWNGKPSHKVLRFVFNLVANTTTFLRNVDIIFHKHGVNKLILKKIYRPRPGSPFVKFKRRDGSTRYLWCTFGPGQIDLNIKSEAVRRKFSRDIKFLESIGADTIRLDAVAYAGKKRGTNSFFIKETKNFIKWLAKHSHNHNMMVVPEVHFHYKTQIALSKIKGVDFVYDFSLPILLLHAIYSKNTNYLINWIKLRPTNIISTLDTHDGIGVIDAEGLLPPDEVKKTSDKIYQNGGNATKRASGNNSQNVDTYQINCTYYSALDKNDDAYLLARAIQLFLPGIPQIYYVGMLAGENDQALLKKTNNGRDINRHYYSIEEIDKASKNETVKELFYLCKLRNGHPAFKGSFSFSSTKDTVLVLEWKYKRHKLKLITDFQTQKFDIIKM